MPYQIEFEPLGRKGACLSGKTLLECARALGVDLVNICGGEGSCGRCVIQILSGDVSALTQREIDQLSPTLLDKGFRLACLVSPLGECVVRVPPESLSTPQRTQTEGIEQFVEPDPLVHIYQLSLTPPSLDDLQADAERLIQGLLEQHGVEVNTIDFAVERQFSNFLREHNWLIQVAVRGTEIIHIQPAAKQKLLGLAVDLGTTKIAAYLVDLQTGETLCARGEMNPQIAYGEDIVTRMVYAHQDPTQARLLQELVVDALNELTRALCAEVEVDPTSIAEMTVVANTTMHHLFLGLPISQLMKAPYIPAAVSHLDIKARELGLQIAPGAYLHLLPNIAGYVGADHVAMILATGGHQPDGITLGLDIGTNTEIYLSNNGKLSCLSCASGPAFEGAHIKHGMRAAKGAIEHVRFEDDVLEFQTIGDAPPVGLCGSGILDALAQLLKSGIIDERGRMCDHPRVEEIDGIKEFVLVSDEKEAPDQPTLTFTQKDVRELQLAKGAIWIGIKTLLEMNNLRASNLDEIIIAGAFGSYIDIRSAIAIGMLPNLSLERFKQVGNAAGMGAKMALISKLQRNKAQLIANQAEYIELATAPNFARCFARSLDLGPIKSS